MNDLDPVRILLVTEPVDNPVMTWTPVTDRYHARLALQDFVDGELWEGARVMRALIVEQAE